MDTDRHRPLSERPKEEKPAEGTDFERRAKLSMETARDMTLGEFSEFVALLKHPWRLAWTNFLFGIARGTGIAIGISIVGAGVVSLMYILLKKIVTLPLIGELVANVVDAVREQMQKGSAM